MALTTKIADSLYRRNGPLTKDLVQVPAKFGLGKVPAGVEPDDVTGMVCGFCSVGCRLNVHLKNGRAVNLTPDTEYPVNSGMACPKGWEALTPLFAADRATTPLLKNNKGEFEAVDWDMAMQTFTLRLKAIQDQHGKDAVAWLGTGQIATEELAFLGALSKFGMGIVHGDSNTRQCMATSVAAYKESFGFDAPPYSYEDLEESDVLVFIGSNLCIAHPILWQRVLRNKNKRQIIVVDPRKTETAMQATAHYAIKPKSDLTFLYGLAQILIERGWINREYIEQHTDGFSEFAHEVRCFTSSVVSEATGLTGAAIEQLAEIIHSGKRVSFWWTMGVNQGHEATRTAQAIINLALMTGNIGRPGTGANSITGQCNAMGSRLFSNTSSLFCGRDFINAEHRADVARILKIDPRSIPDCSSLAYDQIVEQIDAGKIKALWIIGTNGAHSWVHNSDFTRILDKLEFLVVQDMYHSTETARRADLILPAAGWGEKEGTLINSERRIGLIKKVSRAPGQALSDFNIFKLVAHYWGCQHLFNEWSSAESTFQILKQLSEGQPCDITGIRDYKMIDECGGVQWPFAQSDSAPVVHRRLFADGKFYRKDGRAKFTFESPRAVPDPTNQAFPFILLTGRGSSAQWHTQTRTGKSDILAKLHPDSLYVDVNPDDAKELGIKNNSVIRILSRRGDIKARAVITPNVQKGQLFAPMHYSSVNKLLGAAFDPYSRQPAYKSCAVAIVIE